MDTSLTKEFVEKLVKEPIETFDVGAGAAAGDNVAGELKRITVTTKKGETINLVHKTIPNEPHAREFIVESGAFRTENALYSIIAPKLIEFAKSKNVKDSSLPVPKFYAGFNNDENDYITLEDVRPSGYVMPNKFVGLNVAETSLILKELARFHALTYSFLRHEGEQFLENDGVQLGKSPWKQPEKQEEISLIMQNVFQTGIDIVSRVDPELAKSMSEKLGGAKSSEYLKSTGEGTDVKFFPCIIHGDIWLNNTMIKYDGEGKPTDVKLIDFQQTRRGNIFEDLQYFMVTSTTPAFRQENLYNVLGVYYDSFIKTLIELQVPPPIGFSRGFLIDSFESCRLSSFVYIAFAIPMQLGEAPSMNFGPPQPTNDGAAPPQEMTPPPNFDMKSIPVEVKAQMFAGQLRMMIESSQRAKDRLVDISREMQSLQLL